MRVCVYGAGAIGGHLAARLVADGRCEVSVVARGAHLEAIRQRGIVVRSGGAEIGGRPVAATADADELPPQDIVFVTLKASSTPDHADKLSRLVGPAGVGVFIANGIPWWWRHGRPDPGPLEPVDPQGALWHRFGPARTLGGVVYSGNEVAEPGVILHRGSNRWPVGEPDGTVSDRARAVVDLMISAGLGADIAQDIRREALRKLMRNVSGNPVSALIRWKDGPSAPVAGLVEVGRAMVREALAVGAAQGVDLRGEIDPETFIVAGEPTSGPSSMLQDALADRPLEVEPILGQLQAFGREAGVATPTLDVVAALLRGLDYGIGQRRAG